MGGARPRAGNTSRAAPRSSTSPNSPQPCYHRIEERKCEPMPTSPPTHQPRTSSTTVHPDHTPNNPEQIRTNLNTAERSDQIGAPSESPRISPIKTIPNKPSPRRRHTRASPPPYPRLFPSFLRRQEWECAHAHARTKHLPQENSSLPPGRGEVRWGVRRTESAPAARQHPDRLSRRSCLRRNDGGAQE